MNWYKTAKLAEVMNPQGKPMYSTCGKCGKFKDEYGQFKSYEEMDAEEKSTYDQLRDSIELSEALFNTDGDPIKMQKYLEQNPHLEDLYFKRLKEKEIGESGGVSHTLCPECMEKEMAKYVNK